MKVAERFECHEGWIFCHGRDDVLVVSFTSVTRVGDNPDHAKKKWTEIETAVQDLRALDLCSVRGM